MLKRWRKKKKVRKRKLFLSEKKKIENGETQFACEEKAKAVEEKLFLRRQKMGNASIARKKKNRLVKEAKQ